MDIDELKAACRERIAAGGEAVVLVIPGGPCRGNGVRLCKTRGPIGELLGDNGKGMVCRFNAKAVLKFIEREEQVK